ncbi:MAG: hypothetical protein H7A25_23020 [Leptospiraceae bacterium]|nr:hypothetical protein [Leptospiraceae bacterium]MCP5502790.1 hypothetical protein [Leptospiraceae bacterium]
MNKISNNKKEFFIYVYVSAFLLWLIFAFIFLSPFIVASTPVFLEGQTKTFDYRNYLILPGSLALFLVIAGLASRYMLGFQHNLKRKVFSVLFFCYWFMGFSLSLYFNFSEPDKLGFQEKITNAFLLSLAGVALYSLFFVPLLLIITFLLARKLSGLLADP